MSKKNKRQPLKNLAVHPSTPSQRKVATAQTPANPGLTALPETAATRPVVMVMPCPVERVMPHPATLEQQRAADALRVVRNVDQRKYGKEFRRYVESLPATIVMNGLGQACATLLASGGQGTAYYALYEALQGWLCRLDEGGVYRGENSLIDALVGRGQSEYVHAQAEALAYLVWLKKFSQAFLRQE